MGKNWDLRKYSGGFYICISLMIEGSAELLAADRLYGLKGYGILVRKPEEDDGKEKL